MKNHRDKNMCVALFYNDPLLLFVYNKKHEKTGWVATQLMPTHALHIDRRTLQKNIFSSIKSAAGAASLKSFPSRDQVCC